MILSIPALVFNKLSVRIAASVLLSAVSFAALGSWLKVAQAQTPPDRTPLTVRSDIQEANSETGVITARGNVQFFYPARQIQGTAAQAQYFSRERRLILTGNVYVLQEGNSMRAEIMTYLIDEGRFIATPQQSQQVESIYLVTQEEQKNSGESQPAPVDEPFQFSPAPPLSEPTAPANP